MSFDIARYHALVPEIIAELIFAELRARAPVKFEVLTLENVRTSLDWRRDFSLDSMDRMALASACAEFFNVYDSGREDTLLGVANCERWSEVVILSQQEHTRNITFRSSGSTGTPRHFRHRAQWLEEEATFWASELQRTQRTRIATHVPTHHIYGYLWVALLSATSGLPVTRLATESLRAPALASGDVLITTPHLLESWCERGTRVPCENVVAVCSTGRFTRMSAEHARVTLGLESVWEIYGSSETAGLGIRRAPEVNYSVLPYLRAIISTEAKIESFARELGESVVQLAAPDTLTAITDTQFSVGARTDDVVKIRGHRIDLNELRALLVTAPGVIDAGVRKVSDAENDALKVVLVMAAPASSNGGDEHARAEPVRAWLHSRWQHAGYISAWHVANEVPRNSIGKLTDW